MTLRIAPGFRCSSRRLARQQRGVALITSLLLMLVITMLAVSMYRSVGGQEKIAGNLREKQRALHAAVSAQKYAEWWLSTRPNISAGSVCSGVSSTFQVCSNQLKEPARLPWNTVPTGTAEVGFTYAPPTMVINDDGGAGTYFKSPSVYIHYLGVAPDGQGAVFQIDAVGYGGGASSVAVVESTFQVTNGVKDLGGL